MRMPRRLSGGHVFFIAVVAMVVAQCGGAQSAPPSVRQCRRACADAWVSCRHDAMAAKRLRRSDCTANLAPGPCLRDARVALQADRRICRSAHSTCRGCCAGRAEDCSSGTTTTTTSSTSTSRTSTSRTSTSSTTTTSATTSSTSTTVSPCPDNPQGGPRELLLLTAAGGAGGDLDVGWVGIWHGFPALRDSVLITCLDQCGGGDTDCTGTGPTGPGTPNGSTFGAPVPLLTAGTPLCVVPRFDGDVTVDSADFQTGAVRARLHLAADVYITLNVPLDGRGQVCPQCSGSNVGDAGTCVGGQNDGEPCRVDGRATVVGSTGGQSYALSVSCLPAGTPIATLPLVLDPLTTASASGGRCPGQVADDLCGSSGCTVECTGRACLDMIADPVDPSRTVCRDTKGGINQLCCGDNSGRPCFPTAGGGSIARVGRATVPTPDGPDPLPTSSDAVLVSVFCVGAMGNHVFDDVLMGLPGPAALIQPVSAKWIP